MGSTQRGAIVSRNDNGTLERVDGTNTYIGSATLESGKVVTKRFRRTGNDEAEVERKWLKWQGRNIEAKEEPMAEAYEVKANGKAAECPFSGRECGPKCPMYSQGNRACSLMLGGIGLFNISVNLSRLDPNESLELIAMALGDLGGQRAEAADEPLPTAAATVEDGVKAYLEDKSFLTFVNLHSKTAYSPYRKFCEENGFPAETESGFSSAVRERYPELRSERAHGGCRFVAV